MLVVSHPMLPIDVRGDSPPRRFANSTVTREADSVGSDRRVARHRPFRLVEHGEEDRHVAETFIAARFKSSFRARIETFMPRLFTMRDEHGRTCGAFGLRSTSCRLFIEQYLALPIEVILAASSGSVVERRSIIEVGHFSGTFPGAMREMIVLLTAHLHGEGFQWVAFSGTKHLRNAFARVGLEPTCVQPALLECLPAAKRAGWGQYYQFAPQVMTGRIRDGVRALGRQDATAEARR